MQWYLSTKLFHSFINCHCRCCRSICTEYGCCCWYCSCIGSRWNKATKSIRNVIVVVLLPMLLYCCYCGFNISCCYCCWYTQWCWCFCCSSLSAEAIPFNTWNAFNIDWITFCSYIHIVLTWNIHARLYSLSACTYSVYGLLLLIWFNGFFFSIIKSHCDSYILFPGIYGMPICRCALWLTIYAL